METLVCIFDPFSKYTLYRGLGYHVLRIDGKRYAMLEGYDTNEDAIRLSQDIIYDYQGCKECQEYETISDI